MAPQKSYVGALASNPVDDLQRATAAESEVARLQAELDENNELVDRLLNRAKPDPIELESLRHANRMALEDAKARSRESLEHTKAALRPAKPLPVRAQYRGRTSPRRTSPLLKLLALFVAVVIVGNILTANGYRGSVDNCQTRRTWLGYCPKIR